MKLMEFSVDRGVLFNNRLMISGFLLSLSRDKCFIFPFYRFLPILNQFDAGDGSDFKILNSVTVLERSYK